MTSIPVSRRLPIRDVVAFGVLALAVGCNPRGSSAADAVQVPRWQPHDFVFRTQAEPTNPFVVSFSATAKGPGNIELKIPGFYDGQGSWKLRVSPTVEGEWSLVTKSSEPTLDGQRGALRCVPNPNPKIHGGLRIDPQHPRSFIFEDGSRFYPLGYECDWLWALDTQAAEPKVLPKFLDKLAASSFNYVILNTYAHDSGFRTGKTADDDFGPPPLFAWAGSNEHPDHSRLNLPFWQHYDRVIDGLYRRGMIAHIMIKVYNKKVRWPVRGSAEDDLFFRSLVARYAAYPNVIWDFSKEAHNEKNLDYKLGRLRFVRESDPYRRLLTVHDDNPAYEAGKFDGLVDFRADQQHKDRHPTMLAQRKEREWPIINVEFGYEQGPLGPEDKTYRIAQSAEEFCRRAWEVCTAGGYIAYYYTYTAWDIIRPEDTPRGYKYFQQIREFFEGTAYWLLEPADGLVSEGFCLAHRGREYVVYLKRAKQFTLKLEGANGPLQAEWFHPFTAQRTAAGQLENGTISLQPPANWGDGPLVLHVGRRSDRAN